MRNKHSLMLFNPGIGDSIIASGLIRKFSRHFNYTDREIRLAGLMGDDSPLPFVHSLFNVPTYSSGNMSNFLREAKSITALRKNFNLGHMFYSYDEIHFDSAKKLHDLIDELLDEIELFYDELFILHYSLPFTLLGRKAKDRGLKVHGYFLNRVGGIMQTNRHHEPIPAVIWDPAFIGDRLSRLVTGSDLEARDYEILFPYSTLPKEKVTIHPTTNSPSLSAENWHMDLEVLGYLGYRTEIVAKGGLPTWFNSMMRLIHEPPSLSYTMEEIAKSDFIICYDSAPFHMAWLTGTPAIVKLKGGFNSEWIPSWLDRDKYFFIPATPMYEEQYLTFLKEGINQIGEIKWN